MDVTYASTLISDNHQSFENHLQQRLRDRDVVGVVPAALGRGLRRGARNSQHGVSRAGDGDDAVSAPVGAAADHDADDWGGGLG